MVEIIQPTKKAKGKRNMIIDELIWTQAAKEIAEIHEVLKKNAERTMD